MAESDDKVRIWTYLSLARTPSDSDSNNLWSFWLAKILSCSYSGDAGAVRPIGVMDMMGLPVCVCKAVYVCGPRGSLRPRVLQK